MTALDDVAVEPEPGTVESLAALLASIPGVFVAGGIAYEIRSEGIQPYHHLLGFYGAAFRVRMLADGRVVETNNLWQKREIPPEWRDRIPDTAEFITEVDA